MPANTDGQEDFFYFGPNFPAIGVPGGLIIEALAQAGAVLASEEAFRAEPPILWDGQSAFLRKSARDVWICMWRYRDPRQNRFGEGRAMGARSCRYRPSDICN
jgi:hypothetical protein